MMEVPNSPARLSLHDSAAVEAQRYKWIESEKAGRDLGEGAIRDWVRTHWAGFLRQRWIEHLEGRAFWIELDRGDFGLLGERFRDSEVCGEILRRLRAGGENLDILCWVHDQRHSHWTKREVLQILEALDINDHRIECMLAPGLARAG
jgi:hypothetical protein